MFRNKIVPVIGSFITMIMVFGFLPRKWLASLGLSDLTIGIIVVTTALVSGMIVERLLRPKPN